MATLTKPARFVSTSLLRLQTDERLAELARDGHEAAYDALVTRYRAELVRASGRIVGPSRAEDAVQQALLNAHRAIDSTADVTNLRAWLHKITHNSSLNMLRSIRDEVPLDAAPAAGATSQGPAEAAELRERLRETLAAIDRLPENQRAALLLRELEGRSHADIADALGITPGAARQALMRGRQRVRQAASMLTPYPLLAKLAAGGSGPGAAGLAELLGGAGASAVAIKLGATVAATGAIAGGIVGADLAVKEQRSEAKVTTTRTPRGPTPTPSPLPAAAAPAAASREDSSGKGRGRSGPNKDRAGRRGGESGDNGRGRGQGHDRGRGRGDDGQNHSGRGRGRSGSTDDASSGPSMVNAPRDNSGSGSSGGSGSNSGSGASGSRSNGRSGSSNGGSDDPGGRRAGGGN